MHISIGVKYLEGGCTLGVRELYSRSRCVRPTLI
jgi:hypothetical protein